jgi:hypothetical protein
MHNTDVIFTHLKSISVSGQPLDSFNPASGQASSLSACITVGIFSSKFERANLQYVENELDYQVPEGSLYLQILCRLFEGINLELR